MNYDRDFSGRAKTRQPYCKPKYTHTDPQPPYRRARKGEFGGSLSIGRRRAKRPLRLKKSMHVTLKSHHAVGKRSLLRHKPLIVAILKKAQRRFGIKVYNCAIAGNHIHLLIKGYRRQDIQNFFRVFAGHTAQRILEECPLRPSEVEYKPAKRGGAPLRGGKARRCCVKNQRKFWSYLLYSRIVAWGKEFGIVYRYITKNTLEALGVIAYTPRLREVAFRLSLVNSS